MNKIVLFILIGINFYCVSAKAQYGKIIAIDGIVPETVSNGDSIYFRNATYIDQKYFESGKLESRILNRKFQISTRLPYPQMLAIQFKSTKGAVPEQGKFFIDPSTIRIEIDTLLGAGDCNFVHGETQFEFQDKFIPYFFDKETYDCKTNNTQFYRYKKGPQFDSKLFSYIKKNPDSFVALWMLIERFSSSRYQPLYEQMAESFSQEMKQKELWKILYEDVKSVRIIMNNGFPVLPVKTLQLEKIDLEIPKANFILVDFWFSHCRPCLEAFPEMKKLYSEYPS